MKVELSGVEMAATLAKIATAMSEAIMAYSMEEAPEHSFHKRRMALANLSSSTGNPRNGRYRGDAYVGVKFS